MMKYLYFLLLVSLAFSRENPFLPSDVAMGDLNSTNIITKQQAFEQISITLPSDAREIESIVLNYKSIDGSIKSKEVAIGAGFDWRDSLLLSKKAAPKTTAQEILDVSVTNKEPGNTTEANISIPKPSMEALNENNSSNIRAISAPALSPALGTLEFDTRVKIAVYHNKIVLNTSDMLLKSYDDGARIVLDFSKSGTDFLTKNANFTGGVLKKATIGSHGKFYRVVLQLDKRYKYSIRQNKENYTIWLGK